MVTYFPVHNYVQRILVFKVYLTQFKQTVLRHAS